MKTKLTLLFLIISLHSFGQLDTSFFPTYTPYSFTTPLIQYGDLLDKAAWNDPCVIKNGGQYIMYASASTGGLQNIKVKIYRLTSNDGYNWTLNPATPVLEPVPSTYYEGGTETPSVVFYKGMYHLYTTSYAQNVAEDFIIAHATSPDGIAWTMDATPFAISDGGAHWMGDIVAEPGAMVKDDTLYVFFTAAGPVNSVVEQSIGLLRTIDGSNIIDSMPIVKIPTDVYPSSGNWWGLSTPSATMVDDTIYLFTDVAKSVNGKWYQAALHQFKSYGDLNQWYHDNQSIHTMYDFDWTNGQGEYLSELRSISPLVDGNKLRIYYAGNRLAEIIGTDTTYHVHFDGLEMHADSNYWGMSTSEYIFPTPTNINNYKENDIQMVFNGKEGSVFTDNKENSLLNIYTVTGQLLLQQPFRSNTQFTINYQGVIFIQVVSNQQFFTKKAVAY